MTALDLLAATGALTEMPRRKKPGRLRALDNMVGAGAALIAGLFGAGILAAIGLAVGILVRDLVRCFT